MQILTGEAEDTTGKRGEATASVAWEKRVRKRSKGRSPESPDARTFLAGNLGLGLMQRAAVPWPSTWVSKSLSPFAAGGRGVPTLTPAETRLGAREARWTAPRALASGSRTHSSARTRRAIRRAHGRLRTPGLRVGLPVPKPPAPVPLLLLPLALRAKQPACCLPASPRAQEPHQGASRSWAGGKTAKGLIRGSS